MGEEVVRPGEPVAILGAGSWGTALAVVLGRVGVSVRLWGRRPELVQRLAKERVNQKYLPDIALPDSVEPRERMAEALVGAGTVVLAAPAVGMRDLARQLRSLLQHGRMLINAAKGLEENTGLRMSEVIAQEIPAAQDLVVAMSGPNLAVEVARGIATTTVMACRNLDLARRAQALFMQPAFRVYTNPDIVGVELGGALKNVIAIGAGISDGLGFGDNSKAALATRGLAEMTRLGVALGACPETFRGLSGIGDLIATCASRHSRNHRVGFLLAQGKPVAEILAGMDQIAEGVPTTRAAVMLAKKAGVEIPIAAAIHAVLFEEVPPRDAVASLMMRSGKDELDETWVSQG